MAVLLSERPAVARAAGRSPINHRTVLMSTTRIRAALSSCWPTSWSLAAGSCACSYGDRQPGRPPAPVEWPGGKAACPQEPYSVGGEHAVATVQQQPMSVLEGSSASLAATWSWAR